MKLSVTYQGQDRFAVRIRDHELMIGRPREADGTDAGPTPAELFVAGLAACVAEYSEMYLARHGYLSKDFRVDCSFSTSAQLPARVESIDIGVTVPDELDEAAHEALQRVVEHCSVHNSLLRAPAIHIRQVVAPSA
jgi:putative redox protein